MLISRHTGGQLLRAALQRLGNMPLLAIGGINALIFPISIVTSIILARLLPKAEYGHLVYFYSGTGLLRLLMNLGLGTMLSRDVAAAWGKHSKLSKIVYSTTIVRLLSILGMLPIVLLVSSFVQIDFLGQVVVAAICASLADFVFAIVAGSRHTWHISAMSAFQPVIYLALVISAIGAIGIRQTDSTSLMLIYALSFLGMTALGIVLILSSRQLSKPTRDNLRVSYIKSALSHAIPSYLASLSSQVWFTIVVGAFGLTGQFERSAEFGIAFSIVTLSIAITGPTVLSSFFPQASYLYGIHQHEELLKYIKQTLALFLKGLVWITILLFTFSDLLVSVFGQKYVPAAPIIVALSPITLMMGIMPVFTLSHFAVGRPWHALTGLCAQVVILLVVLLLHGSITPNTMSIATLLSTITGLIIQIRLLTLTLQFSLLDKNLIMILLAAGVLIVLLRMTIALSLPLIFQIPIAFVFSCAYGLAVLNPQATLEKIRRQLEVP